MDPINPQNGNSSTSSSGVEDDTIILKCPSRFYPKLPKEEINTLDPIFGVGSLENTRILSMHKRELRVTKKYTDKYNFPVNYRIEDIVNKLEGIEMLIVRRPVINGKKIDDKLIIQKGIFCNINNYGYGYDMCNIELKINNVKELIGPDRVFMIK